MESAAALKEHLVAVWEELVLSVVGAVPKVLTAIVLIFVALLVAKVVQWVLRKTLQRLRFDTLLERSGVRGALKRIGLEKPPSEFLPRLVFFLLLFLFVRVAADAFGLRAVSDAIGAFLAFVPNLLAAVLILLLGGIAGQFVGGAVRRAAESSGIDFAASLGSLVSGLVLFMAGMMAIDQLKIDTDIVRIMTIGALASVALGLGLSFGLGSREITHNILAGFYVRKVFRVGDRLNVGGKQGVLRAVTPTMTLLEHEGETIAVANRAFLEEASQSKSGPRGG